MTQERFWASIDLEKAPPGARSPAEDAVTSGLLQFRPADGLVIHASRTLEVRRICHAVIIGQIFGDLNVLTKAALRPNDVVGSCWGNYLALHLTQDGRVDWLLRAPLGHLPVYTSTSPGSFYVSSHADRLPPVQNGSFGLDWDFVAKHLAFMHLKTARTGLIGVSELLGGECLDFTRSPVQRSLVWSPWRFTCEELEVRDFGEACSLLTERIDSTVRCLAPPAGKYLLELSGGLDSSILAAALGACHADVRAVTLSTGTAESDEQIYAQTAAQAVGLEVDVRQVGQSLLSSAAPDQEARPGLPRILGAADALLAHEGIEHGITSFISGAGGDCVFATPNAASAATDALIRLGLGPPVLRTIEGLARYHNASVWSVAARAWKQLRDRSHRRSWPKTQGYLSKASVPSDCPLHPWLKEPENALPGKRSHIEAILASLAHVDGYHRHSIAPSRFPLLSQPVVEAALRVPSWLWVTGGQDRAVARTAYAGRLPPLILGRRTKGALDSYALESIQRQSAKLLPFLLEGQLARHGLLNLAKVESVLQGKFERGDKTGHLLLPLIDTESWARAWLGAP